ncbi:DNA helicase MCM8 [Homalodisca vitripennis]|uniref:DNA helicase MCM8 n=1 Tax=Homalodisca vitripennis TaxID=197043 RepID=UPI001EECB049|nr:DNA helicase MCM8 [Homalodisca vitripennis]
MSDSRINNFNKSKYFRGRGSWKFRGRGRGSNNRDKRGRGGNFSGTSTHGSSSNFRGSASGAGRGGGFRGTPGHGHGEGDFILHSTGISSISQPPITAIFPTTQVPSQYKGWRFYHPQESFMEGSPTVNKTRAVEGYLQRNSQLFIASDIEERRCCSLDYKHVTSDTQLAEDWPSFQSDLLDEPDHSLNCLGLAIHQFTLKELERDISDEEGHSIDLPAIRVRLLNYEPITHLKNLKANFYGKLVCVRGTIIRVGNMKLLCTWLGFQCAACGSVQTVRQPDGAYTQPTVCASNNCRARSFNPLCSSTYTQTLNWQTVRLQELVDDDQREGGRVPRNVEVELTEDLVDSCVPGDEVTITGIVKVRTTEEGYKKNKSASMFVLYILGVSVANGKATSGSGRTSGIEFNIKDYYAIQEIHAEPSLFRLLVNSLCPAIYGHEMVKAGLLLGLFGGSQANHSRADSHVLVVGDPGLGKSQMLQACASVAPRGVYVCGNTSTASGLTVTLTREGGGDFALEAGALVLADQGCCCIDEFDKMSVQHQALLEAMEQQVISIAKAGVVCSLPARTAILAAANPASGHYNRAKTVAENLRMGQPLLSRFDLVFILLDKPNEQLDSLLSEHVMALHSGVKQTSDILSVTSTQSNLPDSDVPLSERLKLNGESVDLLPHVLLRKYIAYARKYVPAPRLSAGAAKVLQHFYLELRKQHQTLDATPVTTRQLESLIRLTQARAKLELREEATEQDAVDVVELMRWSMVDTFIDEFGALDFHRSTHGSGMSTKNQAKKFISALQKKAELQAKSVFTIMEMKEVAALAKIQVGDFFTFVSNLNTQGYLIKKGKQVYQLLSVDF